MSQINDRPNLYNIDFLKDIPQENAASYSGGSTVKDVTLYSKPGPGGDMFESDDAVKDLRKVNFNDKTAFIAVNNNKTWRFYENTNFTGKFIEVGPDEARNVGKFGMKISSFKSV